MAKPGRNDPCHCGSGNKYKKCCLAKDEAAERDSLVKAQARREQPTVAHRHERAAEHRLPVDELMAEVVARLSMAEKEDAYEDELDAASNAVVQLVGAAKLDEAEAAARDLLVLLRYKLLRARFRAVPPQHGHRGNRLTIAAMSLRRMVAIEFGMCRSGRKGGSSGSVTVGYGKLREQRGGTRS